MIYLNVPYAAKEIAKAHGAKWNAAVKKMVCGGCSASSIALLYGSGSSSPTKSHAPPKSLHRSTTRTVRIYARYALINLITRKANQNAKHRICR